MPCKVSTKKAPKERPNTTVRDSILDDISKIIPGVDKYGSFKMWAHICKCKCKCKC